MLILNFHKQLRNGFKREIVSYSTTGNFVFDTADDERLVYNIFQTLCIAKI